MADVFISYSRKDKEFVTRLHEALRRREREAWVDWDDIRPTEEFMQAIFRAIEGADTFVCVLTPDSIASAICARELAHAVQHNKRLVPVVARDMDASAVPETVAKLNWIFCRESDDLETAIETLVSALDTDLEWVRAHTRLLTRAIEWEAKGKNDSFVLRGIDLREAERWLTEAGTAKERQPTPLQTTYILASRKAAARQQRVILGSVIFALAIAIGLALFAYQQRSVAEKRRLDAERQRQIAVARALAAQSEMLRLERPDLLERSVLLAIESMRRNPSLEADRALRAGLALLPRLVARVGHEHRVDNIAFSPDGSCFASAAPTIRICATADGSEIAHIVPPGGAGPIAFSPDGLTIASGGDKTTHLWDVRTGSELLRLPQRSGNRIVFLSDGKRLATNGGGGRVWDLATGRAVSPVPAVKISSEGKIIDGANLTEEAKVFETISADGKYLARKIDHKNASIWDISSGEGILMLKHDDEVNAMAFSPDGRYFATACFDHFARIIEVPSGREVMRVQHTKPMHALAFSPDGQWLATAGDDDTAHVWEVSSGREVQRLSNYVYSLAILFSPDGRYVLTGSVDSAARLWDVRGRAAAASYPHPKVHSVVFSKDGKRLVTKTRKTNATEELARLWEIGSNQPIAEIRDRDFRLRSAEFLADGNREHLALTSDLGGAFSPDGKYLATGADSSARIVEVSSGREVARHIVPGGVTVGGLVFSPDSRFLATTQSRIWEVSTGREIVLAHESRLSDLVFSPDGRFVATAGSDLMARIWKAATGEEIVRITLAQPHAGLAFAPDGKYLVTATGDAAEFWLWRPEDLISEACGRLTRNLTREEWRQYLGVEPYAPTCPGLPAASVPQ